MPCSAACRDLGGGRVFRCSARHDDQGFVRAGGGSIVCEMVGDSPSQPVPAGTVGQVEAVLRVGCDEERGAPQPKISVGQRGFDAVVRPEEAGVQGSDRDRESDVSAAALRTDPPRQRLDESDVLDQARQGPAESESGRRSGKSGCRSATLRCALLSSLELGGRPLTNQTNITLHYFFVLFGSGSIALDDK